MIPERWMPLEAGVVVDQEGARKVLVGGGRVQAIASHLPEPETFRVVDGGVGEALDPGIVDLVRVFREVGFTTTDSGDGVTKRTAGDQEALPFPHLVVTFGPEVPPEHIAIHARHAVRLALHETGRPWLVQVSAEYRSPLATETPVGPWVLFLAEVEAYEASLGESP